MELSKKLNCFRLHNEIIRTTVCTIVKIIYSKISNFKFSIRKIRPFVWLISLYNIVAIIGVPTIISFSYYNG
jgi:hypothetical protein